MTRFDRAGVTELLTELATRLAADDIAGRIYVVGGTAAMALEWDARRSTRDIDALFAPRGTIKKVAAELAAERALPPEWLSDAVVPFLPPGPAPAGRVLGRFGALDIVIAPAEHLLAMKMAAFRHSDLNDLRLLTRHLGLTDADDIAGLCESIYGTDGVVLPPRDDLVWQAQVVLDTTP